jgi:hypothetical protein
MRPSGLQQRLEQGDLAIGVFTPAGTELETPGILRWSMEDGAELELVDLDDRWPTDPGQTLTVHGSPNDGDPVTLLGARVSRIVDMKYAARLRSPSLFLGAHIFGEEEWPVANYRPATLHEWLPETGLEIDYEPGEPSRVSVTYQAPESRGIQLTEADVRLQPSASWSWSYAPDWRIETSLSFSVRPTRPHTIAEHLREYGMPLLAFSTFAADRPDGILRESYFDPTTQAGVVALRRRDPVAQSEWRPIPGHYLFTEADLPDLDLALRRWFELWQQSFPALGLLRQAISAGKSYDPPRFMNLYTAAEGYWKAAMPGTTWNLRGLLDKAMASPGALSIDKKALPLIGATRKYFAHLEAPRGFTPEEIDANVYASTRRLHAILQACLLGELGFDSDQSETLIRQHYRDFPIPGTDDS